MKPKKNPKADLENQRGSFMLVGLVLTLAVVWGAFEWKTYEGKVKDLGQLEMVIEDEEIIPITQQELKPPPPPPPPPPPVITVVEDDVVIEEEIEVEEVETDQEEVIEIIEEEEETDEVFNFAVVEDKPVYPGCEDATKAERNVCFQQGIMKHISKNFKYPEIAKDMGIQEKIFVNFVIDKKGKISNAQVVRGNDKHLKKEALRLVNSIPGMVPAKQRGKPVQCSFTIPINFKLQ